MCKQLVLLFSASVLFISSCEREPLDRSVKPQDEITAIEIIIDEEDKKLADNLVFVNRDQVVDDSGLPNVQFTFVGNDVTFKSTTRDDLVEKRVWHIPQPVDGADLSLNVQLIEEENDFVARAFNRGNNASNDRERSGFPIILTETLKDGSVNRVFNQIQVREKVVADFKLPSKITPTNELIVEAPSAAELGLSSADFNMNNQVLVIWDFGPKPKVTALSTGKVLENNTFTSNNLDETFKVEYPGLTPLGEEEEPITFIVRRNFPLTSESFVQKRLAIVEGVFPDPGEGMRLSPIGNTVTITYPDAIANQSDVKAEDFVLTILDKDEISQSDAADISISSLKFINSKQIELTLSKEVPSALMDNLLLSFSNEDILAENGKIILTYTDREITEVANEFNVLFSGFEVEDDSWDNAWEDHSTEVVFTQEKSFTGNSSLLFDVKSNPTGIGAWRMENSEGAFVPSTSGDYQVSYWVYVETADADTTINMFWLDGSAIQWTTNVGTTLSELEKNKWVKVSGTRLFEAGTSPTSPFVRIVGGNAKVYVDHIDMRPLE